MSSIDIITPGGVSSPGGAAISFPHAGGAAGGGGTTPPVPTDPGTVEVDITLEYFCYISVEE